MHTIMPPSPRVNVVLTAEIKQALADYAAANNLTVTDLLRDSALRAIGREDLIEGMPTRGRPWPKPDDPASGGRKPPDPPAADQTGTTRKPRKRKGG